MPTVPLWTLTDGHAGNRRQANALAAALSAQAAQEWRLESQAPWRWLAPRRWPGAGKAFGPRFASALQQPPALAIGCGRQAALATRLLRERGASAIQILDPRLDTRHWDLVIAPLHDGLRGDNVIQVLGSLHPVDIPWLAQARAAFPAFADLPGPRTALLLGGPSAHANLDLEHFQTLVGQLDRALRRDGGSLLASTSRRTPADVAAALRQHYADRPGLIWCDDADGPNPYAGMLGWADRIVVTADSVNMLSEACATEVPVYVLKPARVDGRPRRFLDDLLQRGRIRPLDDALQPYAVVPLRETARVAEEVRKRLALQPGPT